MNEYEEAKRIHKRMFYTSKRRCNERNVFLSVNCFIFQNVSDMIAIRLKFNVKLTI